MTFKKIVQIATYYFLPISLALVSLVAGGLPLYLLFGKGALYLVAANLFLKPVTVITQHKWLKWGLLFRREMGVASFWLFLFHAGGMILLFNLTVASFLTGLNYIFWGGLAGLGMIILGLTSNNFSQRLLKRNWRKVQRLSYLVLLLGSLHASLVEGELLKFFLVSGVFVALKMVEYWKGRVRVTSEQN